MWACISLLSLHLKGLELHGGLLEEVIVRVAIKDNPLRLWSILSIGDVDVDTILFEEVSCLQSTSFREAAITWSCLVEIGWFLGSLLESSKDYDFTASDLEGTHIKELLRQAKFK